MDRQTEPIYSTVEDDPRLRDGIHDFVVHLAEKVDALQDAETAGELERLAELCGSMAEESERLGYAELTQLSRVVVDACARDKQDEAHTAMLELTDISHRVRLGHRGSA